MKHKSRSYIYINISVSLFSGLQLNRRAKQTRAPQRCLIQKMVSLVHMAPLRIMSNVMIKISGGKFTSYYDLLYFSGCHYAIIPVIMSECCFIYSYAVAAVKPVYSDCPATMITIQPAVPFFGLLSSPCNGLGVSSLKCNREPLVGFSTGQQSLDKISIYLWDTGSFLKTH